MAMCRQQWVGWMPSAASEESLFACSVYASICGRGMVVGQLGVRVCADALTRVECIACLFHCSSGLTVHVVWCLWLLAA
jgi:hypothetical protein